MMKTIKVKTTDLTGRALDWAVGVAVSIDGNIEILDGTPGTTYDSASDFGSMRVFEPFEPTTNWGQLGPLVEKYKIEIIYFGSEGVDGIPWEAQEGCDTHYIDQCSGEAYRGPTPQIAACRAIVAAKLGDEVDVPEVLV